MYRIWSISPIKKTVVDNSGLILNAQPVVNPLNFINRPWTCCGAYVGLGCNRMFTIVPIRISSASGIDAILGDTDTAICRHSCPVKNVKDYILPIHGVKRGALHKDSIFADKPSSVPKSKHIGVKLCFNEGSVGTRRVIILHL